MERVPGVGEGSVCLSVTRRGFPSLRATETTAEVLLKQRGKGWEEILVQWVPRLKREEYRMSLVDLAYNHKRHEDVSL